LKSAWIRARSRFVTSRQVDFYILG